jgi:tRNA (guanine-N7-)-methyltransferase
MGRTLKRDIPGPDWRVDLERARELGWQALFAGDVAAPLPLVVEIGFGRGEFLLDQAARHPAQAFVGVEYSPKRVLKMARRLARSELRNVRLVQAPAERLVAEALADGAVSCFWINFPDPWPKKRHFKRRLVQAGLVAQLARRLVPGGRLEIATDHEGYAEWIHERLAAEPLLVNRCAPEPFLRENPGRAPTAYEMEWRALGRPFHFFRYARRG